MNNDEKLIDLVKANRAIYDKTDIFYSNKDYVKELWQDISNEMKQPVPVCQKRWRYLRDYFVRQLHMTQNNQNQNNIATTVQQNGLLTTTTSNLTLTSTTEAISTLPVSLETIKNTNIMSPTKTSLPLTSLSNNVLTPAPTTTKPTTPTTTTATTTVMTVNKLSTVNPLTTDLNITTAKSFTSNETSTTVAETTRISTMLSKENSIITYNGINNNSINNNNNNSNNSNNNNNSNQKKKSFWAFYDKMLFLKPFSSTRKTKSKNNENNIIKRRRKSCQGNLQKTTINNVNPPINASDSNSADDEFDSFEYMQMYQMQFGTEAEKAELRSVVNCNGFNGITDLAQILTQNNDQIKLNQQQKQQQIQNGNINSPNIKSSYIQGNVQPIKQNLQNQEQTEIKLNLISNPTTSIENSNNSIINTTINSKLNLKPKLKQQNQKQHNRIPDLLEIKTGATIPSSTGLTTSSQTSKSSNCLIPPPLQWSQLQPQTSLILITKPTTNITSTITTTKPTTVTTTTTTTTVEKTPSKFNISSGSQIQPQLVSTPKNSTPKKRKKSDIYEEILNILKKSSGCDDEVERDDEHSLFFKSILNSVRKIDEEHILAFRTEVLQIIMKYRYMSQQSDKNSDVDVVDTGEMRWKSKFPY